MPDAITLERDIRPRVWLAALLECDEADITEESSILTHPSWDSMAHVQIMLYLEQRYGIEMNEETIESYTSFAAIQALHDAHRAGR